MFDSPDGDELDVLIVFNQIDGAITVSQPNPANQPSGVRLDCGAFVRMLWPDATGDVHIGHSPHGKLMTDIDLRRTESALTSAIGAWHLMLEDTPHIQLRQRQVLNGPEAVLDGASVIDARILRGNMWRLTVQVPWGQVPVDIHPPSCGLKIPALPKWAAQLANAKDLLASIARQIREETDEPFSGADDRTAAVAAGPWAAWAPGLHEYPPVELPPHPLGINWAPDTGRKLSIQRCQILKDWVAYGDIKSPPWIVLVTSW